MKAFMSTCAIRERACVTSDAEVEALAEARRILAVTEPVCNAAGMWHCWPMVTSPDGYGTEAAALAEALAAFVGTPDYGPCEQCSSRNARPVTGLCESCEAERLLRDFARAARSLADALAAFVGEGR